MKTDPNEPAFPKSLPPGHYGIAASGMSIRAYFAAMAMQGLSANPDFSDAHVTKTAMVSVKQADALIEELNKEEK